MINQANRCPGHATCSSFIRSKPVAPYQLVKIDVWYLTVASIDEVSVYTIYDASSSILIIFISYGRRRGKSSLMSVLMVHQQGRYTLEMPVTVPAIRL